MNKVIKYMDAQPRIGTDHSTILDWIGGSFEKTKQQQKNNKNPAYLTLKHKL